MTDIEIIIATATEIMGWEKDFRRVFWVDQEKGIKVVFNDIFFVVTESEYPNYLDACIEWNPLVVGDHWIMIVHELIKRSWEFGLSSIKNGKWEALFQRLISEHHCGDEWEIHFTDHNLIGYAVCSAALKTVGIKV